ncbi:hypothetical protein ABT282_37905 [Streptomyces sp. NPDC000927]
MLRSVIIRLIAVPSPSGSRLSHRTTVPVRRLGVAVVERLLSLQRRICGTRS